MSDGHWIPEVIIEGDIMETTRLRREVEFLRGLLDAADAGRKCATCHWHTYYDGDWCRSGPTVVECSGEGCSFHSTSREVFAARNVMKMMTRDHAAYHPIEESEHPEEVTDLLETMRAAEPGMHWVCGPTGVLSRCRLMVTRVTYDEPVYTAVITHEHVKISWHGAAKDPEMAVQGARGKLMDWRDELMAETSDSSVNELLRRHGRGGRNEGARGDMKSMIDIGMIDLSIGQVRAFVDIDLDGRAVYSMYFAGGEEIDDYGALTQDDERIAVDATERLLRARREEVLR